MKYLILLFLTSCQFLASPEGVLIEQEIEHVIIEVLEDAIENEI